MDKQKTTQEDGDTAVMDRNPNATPSASVTDADPAMEEVEEILDADNDDDVDDDDDVDNDDD